MPAAPDRLARAELKTMTPSLNPNNPSPEAIAANHEVRLQYIEKGQERIERKLEWLMRLAIGSLATALIHLAGAYVTSIVQHVK